MRPLPHVFRASVLAVTLLACACAGSVSVLHAKGKPTGDGPARVTVLNSSGETIQQLFIAKTDDVNKAKAAHVDPGSADDNALWGEDELGRAGLQEGKTFDELKLAEDRYDVLVVDPGGREQLVKGLRLKRGAHYILEIGSDWTRGRL